MDQLPAVLVLSFLGPLLALAVLGYAQAARRRSSNHLEAVAQHFQLRPRAASPSGLAALFAPLPEADGVVRGRHVRLYTYATGGGRSRQTWTGVLASSTVPQDLTFLLARESVLTRLADVVGWPDVRLGDAAFDREFEIRSQRPGLAQAILLPEWRERLRRGLVRRGDYIRLAGSTWHLARRGLPERPADVPALIAQVELLIDLAAASEVAAAATG